MADADYKQVACAHCSAPITIHPGPGKQNRRYCGDICKSRAVSKHTKMDAPKCSVDGCSRSSRTLSPGYCETHYYRVRRGGTIGTKNDMSCHDACLYCGKPTAAGNNKFCGDRCSGRFRAGLPHVNVCRVCANEFIPREKNVCCSGECRLKLKRLQQNARYAKGMATSDLFKAKVRNAEYKRKALKASAFIENVDRNSVMMRDKWTCHLCGEKIPRNEVWPKPLFGSLDHVVPLARGGTHCYGNVKAAHLRCNVSKGAKTIGQLGFVFGDVKS